MKKRYEIKALPVKLREELSCINENFRILYFEEHTEIEFFDLKEIKTNIVNEEGEVTGINSTYEKCSIETEEVDGEVVNVLVWNTYICDDILTEVQSIIDAHDNSTSNMPLTTEERLAQMDADVQTNFEMNLTAGGFW